MLHHRQDPEQAVRLGPVVKLQYMRALGGWNVRNLPVPAPRNDWIRAQRDLDEVGAQLETYRVPLLFRQKVVDPDRHGDALAYGGDIGRDGSAGDDAGNKLAINHPPVGLDV